MILCPFYLNLHIGIPFDLGAVRDPGVVVDACDRPISTSMKLLSQLSHVCMKESNELHQSRRTRPFYYEDRGGEDRDADWTGSNLRLSEFESHVDNDPNYAYASQFTIEAARPRFRYASGRDEVEA
jgi:hypothetical protein